MLILGAIHHFVWSYCQLCTPQTLYMHISLFTPTKWSINKVFSTAHSTAFCISENPCLPCLPCSVGIRLQPPTTQLTLSACQHAHQHTYQNAIHTQHYPLHCLPPPSYANTVSSWRWRRGCLLKYSVCLVQKYAPFLRSSLSWIRANLTITMTAAAFWK